MSPVLCSLLVFTGFVGYLSPDELLTASRDESFLKSSFPLSLQYQKDTSLPVSFSQHEEAKLSARLMLFGAVPVKEVSVTVCDQKAVLLGGEPFGIRLYTDGLVVSSVSKVETALGSADPAKDAGIQQGDTLLSQNGQTLHCNEDLSEAVQNGAGKPIELRVRRSGEVFDTVICPAYDIHTQCYRLGLHIRDSIAGIGTMTFTDPDTMQFYGLGHGICDSSSGCLMPLQNGDIVKADITSVCKGSCGSPGTLQGCFSDEEPIGELTMNTDHGVVGTLSEPLSEKELIPIAFRQEVVRGKAELYTTVDGAHPQRYEIEIEEVSYNDRTASKNMVIHITDEKLLRQTGGIVQGMSGSPIIQNGKLIGAVTHVYINDPSRGYAVFAESMCRH